MVISVTSYHTHTHLRSPDGKSVALFLISDHMGELIDMFLVWSSVGVERTRREEAGLSYHSAGESG